ncbi:hypothetical protein KHP62_02450 [Rhodobacteraceae bacterium NNCM2]|nr:hypothetical protein [Coraliihabitans acroporae]
MASLDRAYGLRGATIAVGIALIAGLVQGVLASQLEWLLPKALLLLASCIVLVMAGTVSARQSVASTGLIAALMTLGFFLCRWTVWSVMTGAGPMLAEPPWQWPAYFADHGVTLLWIAEFLATLGAATFGCFAGHERAG